MRLTTTALLASGSLIGAILAPGCAPRQPAPTRTPQQTHTAPADRPTTAPVIEPSQQSGDDVVATIGGTTVTRHELQEPLFNAYGFSMLMLLVQRNIAHDACRAQGLVVSPADIEAEEEWTLKAMFPNAGEGEDLQKLLEQFLAQPKPRDQMSTRTEFDIIIDTNAHLRKLAQPALKDAITDEAIQQEFDERYGAQVQVRHIAVANTQEAVALKAKLAAGEDFAELARAYSRNPDKHNGGLLPPFTIKSQKVPEVFKRVAFSLKDGDISDPVSAEGSFHLIKLERRIAPKAIKIEDVRDGLREELQDKVVVQGVKELRNRFAQQALAQLEISDPTLRAEFDRRLQARDQLIRDKAKIRQEMEKQRDPATAPAGTEDEGALSSTRPGTAPGDIPPEGTLGKPAAAPAPATRPAAPGGATTRPAAAAPSTRPAAATQP